MFKKFLTSVFICALMLCGIFSSPTNADSGVSDFVNRCYKVAFGRDADEAGFNYWKDTIDSGKMDGSIVAYSFMFSDEYKSQHTSNEQYVTDLYTMFMGRDPDQGGYDYWLSKIKGGMSRKSVFAGFANSAEFFSICESYGITAGFYSERFPLDKLNNVNLFIERLYKTCLGRIGDQGGQNYWAESLLSGSSTGISCAANFIMSKEYQDKKLNNVQYVSNLYPAFMGREADSDGLNYWVGKLSKRTTRDQVFEGFANSAEFSYICSS